MRIFYLGPEGSYSHTLVEQVFAKKEDVQFFPCEDFYEIVEKTMNSRDAVGVLPFENSITSSVHDTVDRLFSKDNELRVVGEAQLQVKLNLFGLKGSDIDQIRTVYSHSKALSQCHGFIEKHGLEVVEMESTSQAKQEIIEKGDSKKGFIGGTTLLDESVEILEKDIGDEKFNYTRFVFVAKDDIKLFPGDDYKKMVKFTARHEPSGLAKILNALGEISANLTKIESRPVPGTDWEYGFLAEMECGDMPELKRALDKTTSKYWILGSYPLGKSYES